MWPLHHQHLPFENALLLQSLVDFYFWACSRVFRFHASFILVANIRTRCAVAHTDHQQSLWISEKVVFCLKVDQSIITKLCSFVWHASLYIYMHRHSTQLRSTNICIDLISYRMLLLSNIFERCRLQAHCTHSYAFCRACNQVHSALTIIVSIKYYIPFLFMVICLCMIITINY